MLLLNVNQINQTGFLQKYLYHSLPQLYPQNFHNSSLQLPHATIHFKPSFRSEHKFARHTFLRLIYICSEQISVLILEPVAPQF